MLTLNVRVAETRDRTGVATLRDGSKTVMTSPVVASATQAIAARRANPECDPLRVWGHPPFGRYRLLHSVEARPDLHGEYGAHLLLFEPESGQALEAESFGRLALLAYGGPAGRDGRMRRTQGGLRLSNKMLYTIVEKLRAGPDMVLELAPLAARTWWRFWKRPEETMPLSDTAPGFLSPPVDEASVIEALLMNPALVRRSQQRRERDENLDRDDDRDRDDRRERSGSRSDSGDRFEGKGGESAGAGASGGWDSAPGRGPGVDQAGRIVAGAAAAGLAALASEAAGARSGQDDATGAGDSGAGSGSEGSGATSSDTSTTTSTAY